jgi:hypothetical protein
VWSAIRALGGTSYKAIDALFGIVGIVLWRIARGILFLVTYVPAEIGIIIARMAGSRRQGRPRDRGMDQPQDVRDGDAALVRRVEVDLR